MARPLPTCRGPASRWMCSTCPCARTGPRLSRRTTSRRTGSTARSSRAIGRNWLRPSPPSLATATGGSGTRRFFSSTSTTRSTTNARAAGSDRRRCGYSTSQSTLRTSGRFGGTESPGRRRSPPLRGKRRCGTAPMCPTASSSVNCSATCWTSSASEALPTRKFAWPASGRCWGPPANTRSTVQPTTPPTQTSSRCCGA